MASFLVVAINDKFIRFSSVLEQILRVYAKFMSMSKFSFIPFNICQQNFIYNFFVNLHVKEWETFISKHCILIVMMIVHR